MYDLPPLPNATELRGAYLNRADAIFHSANDAHFLDKHHQKYFIPHPENLGTKGDIDMFTRDVSIQEYIKLRDQAMNLLHDKILGEVFDMTKEGVRPFTFSHKGKNYTIPHEANIKFYLSNRMKVVAGYRTEGTKIIFGQFYPQVSESISGLPIKQESFHILKILQIIHGY